MSSSKYKVLITARSFGEGSDEPFRILKDAGCQVHKHPGDKPLSAKELIPMAGDVNALIVGNDTVSVAVISAAKELRVISRYGAGYDNIDLESASRRGIIVTYTPYTNTNSVAELALALMLCLARSIPAVNSIVKQGGWKRVLGTEMWGKTLGIIGMGQIGKGVTLRAKGFNLKILSYDLFPDYEFSEKNEVRYCTLEELYKEADFISIHLPLLPSTRHLINQEAIDMMKPGAFIVNTARGGIINEVALYNSLREKKIAGAALDVTEEEPLKASPLLELDNIIITSHIGGYTSDAVKNMGVTAAMNVVLTLNGEQGAHVVRA